MGAGGVIDHNLAGFRGIAATRGHELKRIGSVARIETCEEWSPGESRPNTLWFVAQGTDVLRCSRAAQTPSEKAYLEYRTKSTKLEQQRGILPSTIFDYLH